ncbi:hypothetical protein BDZ91DRAFT_717834, partial [Kalaharituber pfeilii]
MLSIPGISIPPISTYNVQSEVQNNGIFVLAFALFIYFFFCSFVCIWACNQTYLRLFWVLIDENYSCAAVSRLL